MPLLQARKLDPKMVPPQPPVQNVPVNRTDNIALIASQQLWERFPIKDPMDKTIEIGSLDRRVQTLQLMDIHKIRFEDGLVSGSSTASMFRTVQAIDRSNSLVGLDAHAYYALRGAGDRTVLDWLAAQYGVTSFDVPGTLFVDTDGAPATLFVSNYSGSWHTRIVALKHARDRTCPSIVYDLTEAVRKVA